MDPKTLASLDPKLKETYERIMGTATSGTNPPPASDIPPAANPTPPPPPPTPDEPTPPVDQLLTTNPFEINTTIPATEPPNYQTPDKTPNMLNPDGLSSIPLETPNTIDNSPFTAAPMGQKTDTSTIFTTPPELNPQPAPTEPTKQPSTITKLLYILAGIIFFLIYTFFWLKIFKFPLPF